MEKNNASDQSPQDPTDRLAKADTGTSGDSAPEVASSVLAAWYGPLPPPSLLAEFDKVIPGGAERIFALAERQAGHRQKLEEKEQILREDQARQEFELSRDALAKEFRIATLGAVSAFILSMTTVFLSFWAIFHGYPLEGSLLGGGTIAALVGAFLYGSHIKKRVGDPPAATSKTA
jgi:uncharacterized membrane protein